MAAVSLHAGSSIAAQGGGFQPQRKDNFAVVISGLDEVDKLVLSTATFKIPAHKTNQGKIKYFDETVFFAGARTPTEAGSIKFIDYIDKDILAILARWRKQVSCPTSGATGWAADYKKSGEVFLLPPGMPSSTCPGAVSAQAYNNRTWVLQGVWPLSLEYDELDHDDDGTKPAMITLELSIDRAVPQEMLGSGGTGGSLI